MLFGFYIRGSTDNYGVSTFELQIIMGLVHLKILLWASNDLWANLVYIGLAGPELC